MELDHLDISQEFVDFSDERSIERYAKHLEGMTFREVLDLNIKPGDMSDEEANRAYNRRSYKGGMGTLIEERFFGYRANFESEADFAEAGVELKATCFDTLKDGSISAGERLVLTMISFDEPVAASLYESHLWEKCQRILLVYYGRDKGLDPYDQRIEYVALFTPPEKDLTIIAQDYAVIAGLVRDGRAEELSESLTTYLGACTKGANAEKSTRPQAYYAPNKVARRRAFSFKRPYMDYVLHHYVMGEPEAESIPVDPKELERQSLGQYASRIIDGHAGKTDRVLCGELGLTYTGNKAQWTQIAYRLLGVQGTRAAEFEKAGIRVRTVRLEAGAKHLVESMPLRNIDFIELAEEESWETSDLREYLDGISYLFVVFEKAGKGAILRGTVLWHVPEEILDGPIKTCWEETVATIRDGVIITPKVQSDGKTVFSNNLPNMSDNPVAHVRPRAARAAYRFLDGTEVGNVRRDAEELPDGRAMTRQAFWLNSGYLLEVIQGHF